jgi:tetratricopeptide (TPR) repeat protein
VFADQGEDQQALTCFHEALTHSKILEDKEGQAWAVVSLGRIAHRQGNDQEATALCLEGLGLLYDLKNRFGIPQVLTDLGDIACAQGNVEEAIARYREGLVVWQEIGAATYALRIYKCLRGVAELAQMQGQAERAARLFGAIEHLRELSGTPIAPVDRAKYDRFVDGIRTQLDEITFTSAWATGRAMTLEHAIAEALAISG